MTVPFYVAPEQLVSDGPWDIGLDWRKEVAAARRLRSDTEATSRTPQQLAGFRAEARHELGAAGAPALAAKTENLREAWVKAQLVEAGRARAASVQLRDTDHSAPPPASHCSPEPSVRSSARPSSRSAPRAHAADRPPAPRATARSSTPYPASTRNTSCSITTSPRSRWAKRAA